MPRPDAAMGDAGPSTPADGGAVDAGPGTDSGVLDCGPHGHAHGDHCHCDPGYVEIGGRCVEPPPCRGPDDELEPNDTPEMATPWTGPVSMRRLYSCIANEDWFRVPLTMGQRVSVRLTFSHEASDIDTYLFAPGADPHHDRPVAGSDSVDDDEEFEYTAAVTGEHLLLVYGYDLKEAPYTLSIGVSGP